MAENIPDLVWPKFVQAVQEHDAQAFLDCLGRGVDVNASLGATRPTALCQLLHDWLDTDERTCVSGIEQCLLALAEHHVCLWDGEVFFFTPTGAASHLLTVEEALALPVMQWLSDYKISVDRSRQLDKALAPTKERQGNKLRF